MKGAGLAWKYAIDGSSSEKSSIGGGEDELGFFLAK
jgi:hypothetical protein